MSICTLIGENIRRYREERGYSQEKLAELSDLHRTYISSVERGKRNISAINIEKIAVALGLEAHMLLRKDNSR